MSIQVGQVASIKRTFCQSDLDRFAALSGDDNPIHVDAEFAARTRFGRTVAHGMLLYSVVCGVLGARLAGAGTLQVEQELMFPTATPTGEEVEIRVEVTDVLPSQGLADLSTFVIRPDGNPGLQGRTRIRLPHASSFFTPGSPTLDSPAPEPISLKGLHTGQRAETRRTFTARDLAEYASLTGDTNPIYTDEAQARGFGLDGLLVPGGLLGGLFSFLLGTRLPGRGTNYLKQRLEFAAPAYAGQTLVASVEIVRIRAEKQLINLRTRCENRSGQTVCQGEALVLVRDVQSEL